MYQSHWRQGEIMSAAGVAYPEEAHRWDVSFEDNSIHSRFI